MPDNESEEILMNHVVLSGRLAADIRDHYTKTGKHVIHFSLAVQKGFQRNEEGRYPVNYFQIEIWNKLADACANYLTRGDRINVKGRLDSDSYPDEHGNTVYRTKVVATEIEFLTPKRRDVKPNEEMPETVSDESVFESSLPAVDDDEIPF
jgi:single-strand binding protein